MGQLSILGLVALGGACGCCSRYLLSELCAALLGRAFPYGTFFVNVLGSLIIGTVIALIENGTLAASPWRPLIVVGFLGGLTTFSSFSLDNILMLQQSEFLKAGFNIVLNVVLSLFAAWIGFQIFSKN